MRFIGRLGKQVRLRMSKRKTKEGIGETKKAKGGGHVQTGDKVHTQSNSPWSGNCWRIKSLRGVVN